MKPASHPSHSLEIPSGLPHSHGPGRLDIVLSCPLNSNHRHRKGLVTDVSGPQRNACPVHSLPLEGLAVTFRVGVAGRNEAVTKLIAQTRLSLLQRPSCQQTFPEHEPNASR